jgi:hypothetical protein
VISPASSQSRSTRPTLLPAFEPVSSSPVVAAPSRKRRFDDDSGSLERVQAYPTPVPTSSTGILPSSPRRPAFHRTASALSERSPLSDVPTLHIPDNGQPLYLGRSSNSCDYQLPYNRLISRRHVSVRYEAPPEHKHASGRVLIECLGWNGCIVRCKGRVEELGKDDIFIVADLTAEIILDVMETRVILGWPDVGHDLQSASIWNTSPTRRPRNLDLGINFASSPPLRLQSPVSPSPSRQLTRDLLGAHDANVHIFEDPSSDDAAKENDENQAPAESKTATSSFDSSLSSSLSENENEENEPLVHSFGPFGADILSKLNSFSAQSPEQARKPTSHRKLSSSPKKAAAPRRMPLNASPVKNHVINQLAFSRVHAVPVSQIFKNLPADLRSPISSPSSSIVFESLTTDVLRDLIHAIPCVGEISRSGKDAAGKPLENEFYYVPEKDDNTMRRDAVVGMGNSGLRSVRKNHKVNFITWLPIASLTYFAAILLEATSSLNIVLRQSLHAP